MNNKLVCSECGFKCDANDFAAMVDHAYIKHNAVPDKEDNAAKYMAKQIFYSDDGEIKIAHI